MHTFKRNVKIICDFCDFMYLNTYCKASKKIDGKNI